MAKKDGNRGLKKIIGSMAIVLVIILTFTMSIFMAIGGVASSVAEGLVSDYKMAAAIPGCGWQELLAFDTVRYDNDFENANPFLSALQFILMDYERYEYELEDEEWKLVESKTLNTAEGIIETLGLGTSSDVRDVEIKVKQLTSPEFVVSLHAKDIEDVISEHEFDEEKREWIGLLITDGVLSEMFGDEAELPDIGTIGKGYFAWPVPGNNRITSKYGPRGSEVHYGLDIAAPIGSPVIAIEQGVVTGASANGGTAGTYVKIAHDKDGYNWESKYFHLSEYKVKIGQSVEKGTVIAASGNTGRSTGPHLHIGITLNGAYTNPLPLIRE